MSIGVYARVSSTGQKLDSQVAEIEAWLAANGIAAENVAWYRDHGKSGKTMRRPEFERLQADIFAGRVKTIIVWKLDRLSRRLRDGVNILADWCERGVRVVVTSQQIDLSGVVGRMLAAVMLGLAEIELEHKRERQAAGIKVAKSNGVYKGRKAGTTRAKPQRARELRERGLNAAEIATALGVSERTAWRYLKAD
ncbi:MAG: recombinase family protein [Pirellulaceae bacterium]